MPIATKKISRTDVRKGAYVPTKAQREIIRQAGYTPQNSEEQQLIALRIEWTNERIEASYYQSLRKGSHRPPEVRMGREFFRRMVKNYEGVGLTFVLSPGNRLFVRHERKSARERRSNESPSGKPQ